MCLFGWLPSLMWVAISYFWEPPELFRNRVELAVI